MYTHVLKGVPHFIYIYISSSPATRHGDAWGERRYSSYSFFTSALDGGEWSASRPGRALPLGKGPPVPTVREVGWAHRHTHTHTHTHTFIMCSIHITSYVHLTFHDLITLNNIWWQAHIMKLLVSNFHHSPVTSYLSGANILLKFLL
jgi:hypothetical protein